MEGLSQEALCLAFEAFSNPDKTLQDQALSYIEKVEKDPSYCQVLFQIYSNSRNPLHRLTALICLKNIVQSIFSGFKRGFKKDCPFSQDAILTLKRSIFSSLATEFTPALREKLNEMAVTIACTAFPCHFDETFEFAVYICKKCATEIKEATFSLSQENFQLFDTLRKICKTAAKRRVLASTEYHSKIVEAIFPHLLEAWRYFSEMVVVGQANLLQMQFGYALDSILIFLIRMGTPTSIYTKPEVIEMIKLLIKKSQAFMKVYATIARELEQGKEQEKYQAWEKTAIVMSYELAFIQNLSPIAFIDFLDDYLAYALQLALGSWPNLTVKKSCLLMLYKTLKLKIQYSSKSFQFMQYSPEIQQRAAAKESSYTTVFNKEMLEQIFTDLLSKSMPIEEEGRENKLETLLADEEPDGIDQADDELECAIRKISLSLVEQLVTTFPELSLELINHLISMMITDQLQADIKTKDSIVSVIALLPHLYLKTGIPKTQWININKILQWMVSKGNDFIFFSRRYPMLLRMWTDIIDYDEVRTFVPDLCKLMSSNDIVTKYSCITALKKIIKLERENKLPLVEILSSVIPAILYICDKVNQPQLVWPVITILSNIMEKSSLGSGLQTMELIGKLNLDKLLEKNDKLIRSALIEMFKTIIVSVPFGTPLPGIFEMSLRFLNMALPKIEEYDTEELAFWFFITKEISPIPEHQATITKLFMMLNSLLGEAAVRMEDSLQLQFLVSILDESVMLDASQIKFDVYALLKYILDKSAEFEHPDEIASIKADIMLAYTTLLILNEKKQGSLASFEIAIDLCCQQILEANKDIAVQGIMKLRSITLPFFNRLMISHTVDLVNHLKTKFDLDKFLEKWIDSMNYLNNSSARKENIVAIMGVLQTAPADLVSKLFEALMGYVVPVVFQYIDQKQGYKPVQRPQIKRRNDTYSERRDQLTKDSVVDSLDLLSIFKNSVKAFEGNLQAINGHVSAFVNQVLQENVFKLMQAS